MNTTLVITLLGPDRTGLVEALADAISAHGGNWLESRLARLGGQFAGIVRVEAPRESGEAILQALAALKASGLESLVHVEDPAPSPTGRQAEIEVIGQDRPGIVRELSGVLVSLGVNVEEMESECASAPMSGETMFRARLRVRLPDELTAPRLRQELERVTSDLLIDIDVAEIESG